jgi:hypothetical protein
MSLRIIGERQATLEEWDRIYADCDYATYFHSREWAEIWQQYTQGDLRPDSKLISFSDGTLALLPFSSRWVLRGFCKQYISSPAGTFGGWLSLNNLSMHHGALLHDYILAHYKNLTWRINPYNSVEADLSVRGAKSDETNVLNLDSGFEAVFKTWTKGHISAARKARKVGVDVREAKTLQDWKVYYEIYQDSLARWGESASSRYGWSLFQHMHDLSSPNIKLWLATHENKIVAGAVCFYAKKHVTYWHGSALSAFFKLRPVNLLMYEAIKNSCEHGYQWFDFNPSGGHEGARAFKKSFRGDELLCPVLNRKSIPMKLVQRFKRSSKNKAS